MIIIVHLSNSITPTKERKILHFLNKIKMNFDLNNIYIYLKDGENLVYNKISRLYHNNNLMDFSSYILGLDLADKDKEDCIFVNDTFFENKLLYKCRVKFFINKIKKVGQRKCLIGHVIKKNNNKYISSYLFFMNKLSIARINSDPLIQKVRSQGIEGFNYLINNDETIKLLYKENYSIFSIEDNIGIKWHKNHLVTECIRQRKLMCCILEQYLSNFFMKNMEGVENISNYLKLSILIYKIENKIMVFKSKNKIFK